MPSRPTQIQTRTRLKRPIIPPLSPPPSPSTTKSRRTPLIVTGFVIYAISAYSFYAYTAINSPPSSSSVGSSPSSPETDPSCRFDSAAATYDSGVWLSETLSGLRFLRRRLARRAQGDVLESCAGTGRNGKWFDEQKCRSWTFVDQSGAMLDVATRKFAREHPHAMISGRARFLKQSIFETIPEPPAPSSPELNPTKGKVILPASSSPPQQPKEESLGQKKRGYTTIIQTMALCSTPSPAALLARLADLLDSADASSNPSPNGSAANPPSNPPRIFLLEHGRSHYGFLNTILDRMAGAHADKHGCWWNRDIERVLREAGAGGGEGGGNKRKESALEIVNVQRFWFGIVWVVELQKR